MSRQAQPELLYRGSRDGFHKSDFVRCCANKGPTMMVVKTIQRNIANVSKCPTGRWLTFILFARAILLAACRSRSVR